MLWNFNSIILGLKRWFILGEHCNALLKPPNSPRSLHSMILQRWVIHSWRYLEWNFSPPSWTRWASERWRTSKVVVVHAFLCPNQGLIQDYQLLVVRKGKSDMFQCFSTILYVHFRNSREGKSMSGMGNPSVPTLYINPSLICGVQATTWYCSMYIHVI